MPELRIVQPGGAEDFAGPLQEALDAVAAAGGGEVVLPPGDYPYRGILVVKDRTTLRGSGGARLLPQDPDTGALRLTGEFPAVRELVLEGRAEKRTGRGDATGVRLLKAKYAELDRVRVTRTAAAAVFVGQSEHFRIVNCTVHDCLADGIHVTQGSRHGQVMGCQSFDNGDDLFALVGYAKDGRLVEHVVIANNVGRNGKARGITCLGARHVAITGNVIDGTDAAGIYLHQEDSYDTFAPSDVAIVGNVLRDVSRRVTHAGLFIGGGRGQKELADGGKVSNGIARVALSNNILDGSGDAGLYVAAEAGDVAGGGNLVRNARHDAVRIRSWGSELEALATD
ncbi:MAG TPA: right-handed parallel beta-helix repeat-containing protein [Azospirillaceae bacterium]|nr:right-handed parallel beta-helix repeat-containing protein [Azospirillaceae bacterium]